MAEVDELLDQNRDMLTGNRRNASVPGAEPVGCMARML
jgi:hypothetical protein